MQVEFQTKMETLKVQKRTFYAVAFVAESYLFMMSDRLQ